MDDWLIGWMDEGWIDERMYAYMYECMIECMGVG